MKLTWRSRKITKTKSKAFEELRDNMELAIDRASLFMKNQDADQALHLRNPYFTIPELIRFFGRLREENIWVHFGAANNISFVDEKFILLKNSLLTD